MVEIVGYRFHPTPQELIGHYLRKKRLDPDWPVQKIKDFNIYDFEPSQLPGLFSADQPDQQDWHFFCKPDYKFGNKNRVNRKTRGGNWKVTGKKRNIQDKRKNVIGWKITLVFYQGSGNSKHARTNWVMHEYHINHDSHFKREFVVVRIKKNPDTNPYIASTPNEGISSHMVASNSGNNDPESALQIETQLHEESQAIQLNHIEKEHDISFDKESQAILSKESQIILPNLIEQAGQSHPPNLIEQAGQSHTPDFNSSNLINVSDGNDEEDEDIAALLYGYGYGEWRMDFSSMCQQQSYQAVDENILPVQMGGVV
ncbi:hypothetical protein LWI29_027718 [Acer saccharum]|uniref:NAC domain-containing protein n=1 Tax=Acer saccharum TaxID=4024 RepID=A0AA39VJE8_ACESA|nr:hypothetical protein LWI29_027718 [Acer saccharum]